MAAQFQIRTESQPSSQSDPSNFSDLDSQTQRGSYHGLAAAASVYAGAYFFAYVADWLTRVAADGYFHFMPAFDTVVATIAIGYASFVAYWCRRQDCEACMFTRMATVFLIVGALGIAVLHWGWERENLALRFSVETVDWVGVWIVAFPAIVTLPPKQVLGASLGAAATVPAVMSASALVNGVPEEAGNLPWVTVLRYSMPVAICVGVAYASAYRVFRLARDVASARRLGSYQLKEKIGSGGMGEVWRARHMMLARPAAVKLIRPESLGKNGDSNSVSTMMRRFEREAQATAMLTSQHSIQLYDFGIADDGVFYYVMELLEGRDLKSLVHESGPVPAERAVHFLRAACDSLADAHHRGLIHRDVKPANIFTCRRGRDFDFVKVLDFGLVKTVTEPGETLTQLTGTNATSGTPGFMAPEMVTGEAPVDGRADIYALGCVAYWLLTGQLVFDGKSPMSILVQHVKEEPPTLRSRTEIEVPPRLEEIVRACLAKDPDDRPTTAQELGDTLAELAATLPPWTQARAEKWWRTNLPNLYAAPLAGKLESSPSVVNG
ncbi:MAG TPA: serine/threonine-protein kinase [Candidatus Krumholzibacteria bacterium]|nr:serine/threonine-protein kinase [Candidatus Krumholzibacteria bacterium]